MDSMETASAYLGIGTNLGDKANHIRQAVELIGQRVGKVLATSSVYESEPWGFVSDNRFFNVAVQVATTLPPMKLLDETQRIEKLMGRTAKTTDAYTDRIIDIDILLYGQAVVDTEILKIPHPLLTERDFVVIPLAEIAPQLTHPTLHLKMEELAARYR